MTPFALSCLLVGICSICFGCLVLYKSPNRKLSWIWFLFTLSNAGWGFGALSFSTAKTPVEALFAAQMTYAFGVLWIASLFHHFVLVFLKINRKRSIVLNYLVSLFWVFLLPKPYFFREVRWVFNSMYYPIGGSIYPVYLIWWMGLVIYSH